MAFHELEGRFKLFIVKKYSDRLDRYLREEAKHADKEAMKELMLSTISITLNIVDVDNQKLNKNDYFIFFRELINKIRS